MKKIFNLPHIIAHRGASKIAPENTLAALKKAIDDGADGVEFDVRLAKDNVPVVFHDATLRRLTAETNLVAKFSAAELTQVDVGSWFNLRFPDKADEKFSLETIPTLARTLDFLKDFTGFIYIELKCRESEVKILSQAVCELINNSLLVPQIIVKSFQLEAIPVLRSICPQVRTAALFAPKIMTILRKEKRLINVAAELGAEIVSVHHSLATRRLMKKAAKKNLLVVIWTADAPNWARKAVELGIYAVITNNPARMKAERDQILKSA